MPLDRPLPDEPREALKMLWSVNEDQQSHIDRHRDSINKVWHVAPPKPREGMLVYADGTDWNPGSGAGYYVYYAGAWHPMSGGGGGGGGYTIVQDEGVALTVRTTLNFVGAGVTATDDGTRTVVTIPGGGAGAVTSVFTRIGAVVAVTGDYTAAQVTNAVSTLGSYPDPTWIPSYAYSKLTGVPTSFTPAAHVHAAADTTSGVFAVARLGTGTPSSSNFLRGDGAWTALPASAVTSVFTRTGAVVAATGDYTAAQVTNAVSTLGSYANPSWITSLAYAKITGAPTTASIQTPWLQNIDAAGFNLNNAGSVGIGSSPDNYYITRDTGTGFLFLTGNQDTYSGFAFRTNYGGGVATRVTITSAGNVGIGTAFPRTKLSVVGLPTSNAGLTTGDIWVDVAGGQVLKIV